MKVYLASRFEFREELIKHIKELEDIGIIVTSRWVTTHNIEVKDEQTYERLAQEDLEDIRKCDVLILFTGSISDVPPRGGYYVEYGYALGLQKKVVVVGDKTNIFTKMIGVPVFSEWSVCLKYLNQLNRLGLIK